MTINRSTKNRTGNAQNKNKALRYFLSVLPGAPFLGGSQHPHLFHTFLHLESQVLQDGGGSGQQFLLIGRLKRAGLQSPVLGALRGQLKKNSPPWASAAERKPTTGRPQLEEAATGKIPEAFSWKEF